MRMGHSCVGCVCVFFVSLLFFLLLLFFVCLFVVFVVVVVVFNCYWKLALPDIAYYLSQGKHLIHICIVTKEFASQQHASVSQGSICSDSCTCCHTEIEFADQTFYLTQYLDTELTSPGADPIIPGTWQGSYWSAYF